MGEVNSHVDELAVRVWWLSWLGVDDIFHSLVIQSAYTACVHQVKVGKSLAKPNTFLLRNKTCQAIQYFFHCGLK